MPVFKPEDLSEAGAGTSNLLQGLASTIANNVCSLYQNAPRGFVGSNPVSDAVNSFNSGFWDDFCGRLPEPKLPTPPSGGSDVASGQCCSAEYDITVTFNASSFSGGVCQPTSFTGLITTFRGVGKILDVRASADGRVIEYVRMDCQGNVVVSEVTQRDEFCRVPTGYTFTVAPGFENACPSQPDEYPPTLPPPQNPGTHPYVGNDGIERPINFSIDFDPTVNGPLVRLPDIPNLCVGFGFAGIDIDLCTNKPGEGNGGDISDIEDKLDQLRDILDRLEEDSKENLNKEDTDETPAEQTDPEGEPSDGSISRCVPNLRFVKVSLTNIPPNANVEVGQAGFDRIDDAGWLTFTKDGFFFPPQRIEFGGAIFEAPPGVECFTMQLRFGFTAVVTTVVKDS